MIWALIQDFPPPWWGEGHIIYGQVVVTARPGVEPVPTTITVTLYGTTGDFIGRQAVPNRGRYTFYLVPNGNYHVAVEAGNCELARAYVTLIENRRTAYKQDLTVEWDPEAAMKSGKSTVAPSARLIYARRSENSVRMQNANEALAGQDPARAIHLLEEIVATDPKDYEAWCQLGTVHFLQGHHAEAEAGYRRALEQRPDYPVALINLGKLLFAGKRYDEAIETLSRMVSIEPRSADAHMFLGEAYLQARQGSRAVVHLEEAIRLDPTGKAEAHLRLAALYDAAGYRQLAAREYEKFLTKRPDYPGKVKLREYIHANKPG